MRKPAARGCAAWRQAARYDCWPGRAGAAHRTSPAKHAAPQHKLSQYSSGKKHKEKINQMKPTHGLVWSKALQGRRNGGNASRDKNKDGKQHQPVREKCKARQIFSTCDAGIPPEKDH